MWRDEKMQSIGQEPPAPLDIVELALSIVDAVGDRWASERTDPDREQHT